MDLSIFRRKFISVLVSKGFLNKTSDEKYLKLLFSSRMGKTLNLENPKTFNEKLQWLKLYDRNPEYTRYVDKYLVREYISEKLGEEYLIPLLGVWDNPDEIDFNALPDQFVLKCNHNSGAGLCICKDKQSLDIENVKKRLKKGLEQDYYLTGREWPYKDVPRKIIAEKYMEDENSKELRDYKFMCFNGQVKCCLVCSERFSKDGTKFTFMDRDWNTLPFGRPNLKRDMTLEKPKNYEKMIMLAEQLSINNPFLRVDFYEVADRIYFGELTFFPASGFTGFDPQEWDEILGEWLELPHRKG